MSKFDALCNFILGKNIVLEQTEKKIVSASGVNGSGQTTVKYEDGSTEVRTGPRPIRNNNPGNLEAEGGFSEKQPGYVGSDGRYAVFATKQDGWNAKINLLKTDTYQNLSLIDAFNRYAPPSENPNYLSSLRAYTGFDLNRKMNSLNDDEFNTLVNAVAKIEGAESYAGKYSSSGTGVSSSTPDKDKKEKEESDNPLIAGLNAKLQDVLKGGFGPDVLSKALNTTLAAAQGAIASTR